MKYTYADFTRDILDDAYTLDISEFKHQAFKRMQKIINFDSGRWVTRSSTKGDIHPAGVYNFNCKDNRNNDYLEIKPKDFLLASAENNIGIAQHLEDIMPDDEWFNSALYLHYAKHQGTDRAIFTIVTCEKNRVLNGISIYKKGKQTHFSEYDRQLAQDVTHFLSRALRFNLMSNMSRIADINSNACAIVDDRGFILDATTYFQQRIQQLIPDIQDILPRNVFDPYHVPSQINVNRTVISTKPINDLFLVSITHDNALKSLTPRQRTIAQQIANGLSNKEIAIALHIDEQTVKTHAKNISNKLGGFGGGVQARAKLIAFLKGE